MDLKLLNLCCRAAMDENQWTKITDIDCQTVDIALLVMPTENASKIQCLRKKQQIFTKLLQISWRVSEILQEGGMGLCLSKNFTVTWDTGAVRTEWLIIQVLKIIDGFGKPTFLARICKGKN